MAEEPHTGQAGESVFLRQVREEMQRSYQPREGNQPISGVENGPSAASAVAELRSAIAAMEAACARVGQTPPAPPTLRGRIGAPFIKLVQRLLFWYTPQIVEFHATAVKAVDSARAALEAQARSMQQLDAEWVQRTQQMEAAFRRKQQDLEASLGVAMARTHVLERRLEAMRLQALARLDREVTRLRAQQTVQETRIDKLAEMPSRPPAAESGERAIPSGAVPHNLDPLYAALEDEFRGSRQEIKDRLSVYLPKLVEAGIGGESMPVLDVGCGRGEWLELLRENQLHGTGIDLNRVALAMCRERALPATEAEAIAYLRSLPDASLGAVTAFHVIEHLQLQPLLDLLDETHRVLKPGGMAIFETPNPNNMFVGTRYFYIDPTHLRPVPPLLARFLAEARGFEKVEVLELHPWPAEHHIDIRTGGDVAARFNECFYGPQDYAIVARKA